MDLNASDVYTTLSRPRIPGRMCKHLRLREERNQILLPNCLDQSLHCCHEFALPGFRNRPLDVLKCTHRRLRCQLGASTAVPVRA